MKVLSVVLLLLIPFSAWPAAPSSNTGTDFLLKVGANLSTFRYNEAGPDNAGSGELNKPYHKFLPGVCAGMGLLFRGRVDIEIDLLYHQKGDRFIYEDSGWNSRENTILHELSLPLLARFNLSPATGPYILAGGELGYVLKAKSHILLDLGDAFEPVDKVVDITESLRHFNYGLVFGGGMRFQTGERTISIEFRYHHGLANLEFEQPYLDESDQPRLKTDSLVLLVGISI